MLTISSTVRRRLVPTVLRSVASLSSSSAPLYPGEGSMGQSKILITGSCGQIGMELVPYLREKYGAENVIASDVRAPGGAGSEAIDGPFAYCDVTNATVLARIVMENNVKQIVHLASVLSAVGEQQPDMALQINSRGIENVLEIARRSGASVFAPSSIAAFGPTTPMDETPNLTVMRPTTVYGLTKVYLELLGEYYHEKFGVDFRSLRYPGIISHKTMPGGGTTDYAVEIFYKALQDNKYTSFLKEDARLPMMYMPDCLKCTVQLMEADNDRLTSRAYNVTAMSFTPGELAEAIARVRPGFTCDYAPDFRQAIADTWPRSLDDSLARADWDWQPDFDIDSMTQDMLTRLAEKM